VILPKNIFALTAAIGLSFPAWGDTPADVIQFLRSTATVLADAHENGPQEFLDHFDRDMPDYAIFRGYLETLVARAEVGSAIDIVSDSGNEQKRVMELDWLLEIQDQAPRRKIIKCTIEKRGKNWKFTSIEPVDFFKY
jgi:hypothetical protein